MKILKINLEKKTILVGKTKDEIGLFRTAISGGMAGLTLWTVLFPVDVIKSRQQVTYVIFFSN